MQRSSVTLTTYLTVGLCAALFTTTSLLSTRAQAQEASAEATEPPAAAAAPEAPSAPPVVVTEVPSNAEAEPAVIATAPAPVDEPPPPKVEPAPLKLASFMHLTNRVQNFNDPQKLNRFSSAATLYLIATGEVIPKIGYQAAIVAHIGPTGPDTGSMNGSLAFLDVIAKLDLWDEFHIWAGRMLVPSDRSNFSGFWFMAPWYYPGGFYNAVTTPTGGTTFAGNSFFGAPVGPRQGPDGRNDGTTVWGQFGGGLFKYYVGAYDTFSATNNPLISGRLNLALISPEPGYFHSSTYYGAKDILAIGASAQYQKSKGGATDYSELSADVLFEKNLNGSGVIDLEASFYKYFASGIEFSYYALASYLSPSKVGPGYLQPLVRVQQAKPLDMDAWTIVEAQLGYIIADDAARLALGYQWQKAGEVKTNALYLGLQLLK
jgi:hypothetical protein